MPQYLIIARDFTDETALERRNAVRAAHLELAKKHKASGNFIKAAAFINEEGNMCGSAMMMEFADREELDKWLSEEPYVMGKVWDSIEVSEVKVAPL